MEEVMHGGDGMVRLIVLSKGRFVSQTAGTGTTLPLACTHRHPHQCPDLFPTHRCNSPHPAAPSPRPASATCLPPCSTTAARLAATLGVPHVDGDILLNHSARLFGPERAPATLYAVAAALASHPTAVLSCGGGVLFSDTRVDFRCTLEGALSTPDRPAIVDMVAVLPQRDGMTLSDIFHSHNARAVAAARARRGEVGWEGADDPAFADRVAAASRENLKFAEAARSVADRVCFWRYRPGGVGEVGFGCEGAGVEGLAEAGGAEVDGLSGQLAKVDLRADGVGTCVGAESSCSAVGSDGVPVGSAADGVVPETPQTAAASTAPSLRVLQVRCAALCQGRVRHVTIAYSPTPDIDVDVTSLASFDPCEVSGRIVSRKEGKTTLLCIVPDQSSLPGSALPESWKKVLGIVAAVADFAHRWHVTLSSGALPASRLIDVARCGGRLGGGRAGRVLVSLGCDAVSKESKERSGCRCGCRCQTLFTPTPHATRDRLTPSCYVIAGPIVPAMTRPSRWVPRSQSSCWATSACCEAFVTRAFPSVSHQSCVVKSS